MSNANYAPGARTIYGPSLAFEDAPGDNSPPATPHGVGGHGPELFTQKVQNVVLSTLLVSGFAAILRSQGNAINGVVPDDLNKTLTADQLTQVVITDPAVLNDERLSFARFVTNLVKPGASLGTVPEATLEPVVKTMLDSLKQPGFTNPATGIFEPVLAQPGFFPALSPAALLNPTTGLQLTGVYNRVDLADGLSCGEDRQIFAMPLNGTGSHTFLIAENSTTVIPGDKNCVAYAKFWTGMTGLSASEKADRLDQFFYTGLPPSSPPAIPPQAWLSHYGANGLLGQIRFNGIPGSPLIPNPTAPNPVWEEDQFTVLPSWSIGGVSFARTPVSNVPYHPFYMEPAAGESPIVNVQRALFQQNLLQEVLPSIINPVVSAAQKNQPISEAQFLFNLATTNTCKWEHCAFQSREGLGGVESTFPDDVSINIAPVLQGEITAKLPPGWTFLQTATALNETTCFGCHEGAIGQPIVPAFKGGIVNQPLSNFFTHEDENRNISPYNLQHELPYRFANQQRIIKEASSISGNSGTASVTNSIAIHSGTLQTDKPFDLDNYRKAVSAEITRLHDTTPPSTKEQALGQEMIARRNIAEKLRAEHLRHQGRLAH